MSKKVYRSAQGKTIDLGALQLQNETVKAVGNMGVNARGDKVNAQNTAIDTRNNSVNRHYKKQTRSNVSDDTVVDSKQSVKKETKIEKTKPVEKVVVPEPVEAPEEVAVAKESTPLGGLADAIAKAKSVKQEPVKTPRQLRQEAAGVKKI